jgi:hypothetical protein
MLGIPDHAFLRFNALTGALSIANGILRGGTANFAGSTVNVLSNLYGGVNTGETATLTYTRGHWVRCRSLYLGNAGGQGVFRHGGGLPTLAWATNGGISIGGATGSGTYYLGDAAGSAAIRCVGSQGLHAGVTGVLRGRGALITNDTGGLRMSGKIIADGWGTQSDLGLSVLGHHPAGCDTVTNLVENASDKGWYAVNKGRLVFPRIGSGLDGGVPYVKAANGSTCNVGESRYAADPTLTWSTARRSPSPVWAPGTEFRSPRCWRPIAAICPPLCRRTEFP